MFNHSEHAKLVWTVTKTLKKAPGARALVFFTPYRPWLLTKDLAFFDLAREAGLMVEKVLEKVMDKVMFDEDRGVSVVTTAQHDTTNPQIHRRTSCYEGRFMVTN